MLSPAEIILNVLNGLITKKTTEKLESLLSQEGVSKEDVMIMLLTRLVAIQEPQESMNHDYALALQPYPYYYQIDEAWEQKSHICLFCATATPLRIDTDGVGTYLKTVGPGWVQLDIRGQLSTTDAAMHNVIVSYRDDALGSGI